MPRYRVPISWEMCGEIRIEASSLEEAIDIARDAILPTDGEYVDGSASVNEDLAAEMNHIVILPAEDLKTCDPHEEDA